MVLFPARGSVSSSSRSTDVCATAAAGQSWRVAGEVSASRVVVAAAAACATAVTAIDIGRFPCKLALHSAGSAFLASWRLPRYARSSLRPTTPPHRRRRRQEEERGEGEKEEKEVCRSFLRPRTNTPSSLWSTRAPRNLPTDKGRPERKKWHKESMLTIALCIE